MIEPEPLQQINRTYVRVNNRVLSYFAGCDYFRMASHPRVLAAVETAVKRQGLNVAASRLTTGNHKVYGQLERELATFFGAQSATLVSLGYTTNIIAAQALSGNFSHALMDEKSHPSFADAARFLDCPVLRYQHRDARDLARQVGRCGPGARLLVLTDGLFAQDGTVAPLGDYLSMLPKDAWIIVDDAHAAGILGRRGQGTAEHLGVSRKQIIQTITLSKAFGAYGGAILGTTALREEILGRSAFFSASTPLPPPLACGALQSLALLKADRRFRDRLFARSNYVKEALRRSGWTLPDGPGPILQVVPANPAARAALKRKLLRSGIFPSFIRYPGGPEGGFFRFVISSEHTQKQLDSLIEALKGFAPAAGKSIRTGPRVRAKRAAAAVAG